MSIDQALQVPGPGVDGPRQRWRVEALARTIESVAPPGAILDAGCGRGRLAHRLAHSGWTVFGIDLAARWLDAPSGAFRRQAMSPYWALARAGEIPWPDGEFGAVALGEVLEHVADDRGAVAEITRVLSPGGVLVMSVPAGPERMSASDARAGHFRRYDRRGLRSLLNGCGLDVELVRGWGWPVGRVYERLAYRTDPGRAARAVALSRAARVLERLFAVEALWDSGERGCGLIAVARRPME